MAQQGLQQPDRCTLPEAVVVIVSQQRLQQGVAVPEDDGGGGVERVITPQAQNDGGQMGKRHGPLPRQAPIQLLLLLLLRVLVWGLEG